MSSHYFPRTCDRGHPRIGHNNLDGVCPLCKELARGEENKKTMMPEWWALYNSVCDARAN
jgi:hypothetical protein